MTEYPRMNFNTWNCLDTIGRRVIMEKDPIDENNLNMKIPAFQNVPIVTLNKDVVQDLLNIIDKYARMDELGEFEKHSIRCARDTLEGTRRNF